MRTQEARAFFGLTVFNEHRATSCDEHGGYNYAGGRRSPRYYGLDGCDECDRRGITGQYDPDIEENRKEQGK